MFFGRTDAKAETPVLWSLQCSCLENPRDRGALWAAVYGVAQSRTRLTGLSSSSSSSNLNKTFDFQSLNSTADQIFLLYHQYSLKLPIREFPGSVVRTLCFHCGSMVRSLVGELRSCMLHGEAKKKFLKILTKSVSIIMCLNTTLFYLS